MKKINSKDVPTICRHKNRIRVPYRVCQLSVQVEKDGGSLDGKVSDKEPDQAGYEFDVLEIEDKGQDLTNPKVLAALQKAAEAAAARRTYEESIAGGCATSLGFTMDCTPEACASLAHAFAAYRMSYADQPNALIWVRDHANKNHEITWAEYQVMYQEVFACVQNLRQVKWGIK